jgi:hypothetical protein
MQSIKDWAASGSVKNILQFVGSANFYRHFIDGFSKVAGPLTALMAFNWTEAARSALVTSKHLFTVAPILVHSHPEKPTVIETAASDFALVAVLSQIQEAERLHLAAYHSRKFKPADVNWEHFAISRVLTARRACRSEHHADVLSRRWDNALKEGGEPSPVSFFNCTIRFQRSFRNPREPSRKRTGYLRIPPMESWPGA